MDDEAAAFDAKTFISQRLKQGALERQALLDELKQLDEAFAEAVRRLPKNGKGTQSEFDNIDANVAGVEFKRSTQAGLTLNEEKQLLRQMDKLKERKKELAVFLELDSQVKQVKAQRDARRKKLDQLVRLQAELQGGLRKLELCERLQGVQVTDLVERTVPVPGDVVARVMGKGGSNIRQIEEQNAVIITVDRPRNSNNNNRGGGGGGGESDQSAPVDCTARVVGTERGVAQAIERLERTTLAVTTEVKVKEACFLMLSASGFSLAKDLEREHGVRIDVKRPEQAVGTNVNSGAGKSGGVVRLSGLPAPVAAAAEAVQTLSQGSSSKKIQVPSELRAVVLGTKGSTIQLIEDELNVKINLDRSDAEAATTAVTVTGPASGVTQALARLEGIVHDNVQVEQEFELEGRHMIATVLGKQNKGLNAIQTETGARITIDKTTLAGDASEVKLVVRGTRGQVAAAQAGLSTKVRDLMAATIKIDSTADPSALGIIVGKGGATITRLRNEHPNVTIEVVAGDASVRVHSEDGDAASAAAAAIQTILDANQKWTMAMDAHLGRQFFGPPGRALREELNQLPGLSFDRDREGNALRFRGPAQSLADAQARLDAFVALQQSREVFVCKEDESVLLAGGQTSILQAIQKESGAELTLKRNDPPSRVVVQGSEPHVSRALQMLESFLEGNEDGTVAVFDVDADVLGALIGKKGATIKGLRNRHQVRIDLLPSVCRIRIHDDDPAKVAAARAEIVTMLGSTSVSALVTCAGKAPPSADELAEVAADCGVQVAIVSEFVQLQGPSAAVSRARLQVQDLVAGHTRLLVPVSQQQTIDLLYMGGQQLAAAVGVSTDDVAIAVSPTPGIGGVVSLEGAPAAAKEARHQLFAYLRDRFQREYETIKLDELLTAPGGAALPDDAARAELLASPLGTWEQLSRLAEDTGAQVMLDWRHRCLRVSGTANAVAGARSQVSAQWEAWAARRHRERVEAWMVPALIGKAGANIKALRKLHKGVKVEIEEADDAAAVVVEGEPAAVADVVTKIRSQVATITSARGGANGSLSRLSGNGGRGDVVRSVSSLGTGAWAGLAAGAVIGRKGDVIRGIQTSSGARIDVSEDASTKERLVKISGSAVAVADAEKQVQAILAKLADSDLKDESSASAGVFSSPDGGGAARQREQPPQAGLARPADNSRERRKARRSKLPKSRPRPEPQPQPEPEPEPQPLPAPALSAVEATFTDNMPPDTPAAVPAPAPIPTPPPGLGPVSAPLPTPTSALPGARPPVAMESAAPAATAAALAVATWEDEEDARQQQLFDDLMLASKQAGLHTSAPTPVDASGPDPPSTSDDLLALLMLDAEPSNGRVEDPSGEATPSAVPGGGSSGSFLSKSGFKIRV